MHAPPCIKNQKFDPVKVGVFLDADILISNSPIGVIMKKDMDRQSLSTPVVWS